MYDKTSLRADDFINHEEIMDTLAYADAHKNDMPLIREILAKARERKGLDHRDASVLLACEDEETVAECYRLAEEIKQDYYGNRIVLFAPLYLSNYCVNGCLYCPYHAKNKNIRRVKLTQEQVRDEVIALQDMGHKRLAAFFYPYLFIFLVYHTVHIYIGPAGAVIKCRYHGPVNDSVNAGIG